MKILSNAHIHTKLCDGKDSPEEIVLAAIEKGFHTIGFSAHSVTPFDLEVSVKNKEAYHSEILRLKYKYKDKISVCLGLELDSFSIVGRAFYDYVIGSVHYIKIDGKYYSIDHSKERFKELLNAMGGALPLVSAYFEDLSEFAKREKPDIIGHFDLIKKFNGLADFFDETDPEYIKIALKAAEKVIDAGCIVEVNTGGMIRGLMDTPYPSRFILEYLCEKDAAVIINSDAHDKNFLDYGFDKALSLLKDVGFKRIKELNNGKFKDLSI